MSFREENHTIRQDPELNVNKTASRRYFSNPSWTKVPDQIPSRLSHFIHENDILLPYGIFLDGLRKLRRLAKEDLRGDPTIFSTSFITRTTRIIYSAPKTFEQKRRPISLEVRAYNLGGVFTLTDKLGWPRK